MQINIKNLTFGYDGSVDNVFDDVSLRLDTEWKTGLVGRNGRGKTTLLKLLAGRLEAEGIKAVANSLYFPYQVKNPHCLVSDIVEEIVPQAEMWQVQRNLNRLKMRDDALYCRYDTLSFGERTKTLLAILFTNPDGFLLIDEPTNHLDASSRIAVGEFLNRQRGFVLVSHDRSFLDSCVDHIVAINKNGIEVQSGNFSSWQAEKDSRDRRETAENQKLEREISRLKDSARRAEKWAGKAEAEKKGGCQKDRFVDRGFLGHKAAKMQQSAQNIKNRRAKAVEEKESLLKDIEKADDIKLDENRFVKKRYITVKDLSISFDGRRVCGGINFEVDAGDKIALTGKNGSGKSSVLKAVCGGIDFEGQVLKSPGLKISVVSQNTAEICGTPDDLATARGIDKTKFFTYLIKLDFDRSMFDKDMSCFSEGQKKKALIAASMCEDAHLYIWDEPLNFIDLFSRIQIENMLKESRAAMLFVEHDLAFVKGVATKTVRIDNDLPFCDIMAVQKHIG